MYTVVLNSTTEDQAYYQITVDICQIDECYLEAHSTSKMMHVLAFGTYSGLAAIDSCWA